MPTHILSIIAITVYIHTRVGRSVARAVRADIQLSSDRFRSNFVKIDRTNFPNENDMPFEFDNGHRKEEFIGLNPETGSGFIGIFFSRRRTSSV